jgi:hypothetical protein
MELPAPALLAGVFLAGVLVGYTIRALISARHRREPAVATEAMISNDHDDHLNEAPLRGFSLARALDRKTNNCANGTGVLRDGRQRPSNQNLL